MYILAIVSYNNISIIYKEKVERKTDLLTFIDKSKMEQIDYIVSIILPLATNKYYAGQAMMQ